MNLETILLILSSIGLLAGIALTRWIHSGYGLDVVVKPVRYIPQRAPRITVIVPARNEARNIRRCVLALLSQTYPNYELVVVDDRSTDSTPQILEELAGTPAGAARLEIIRGVEPPPGWAGKPHALIQAASRATGDWLCFVDADTFASPDLLTASLEAARIHFADLFTILTAQELGSFWEKVVLPLVFTALSFGFPARRVNDPAKPDAIANGQFILIKRQVYMAVGGHQAVRNRIDEDKALAEVVKRSGYRLVVADGRHVARTRMYTSLPEIWEGWTKNIYLGLRDRLWLLLLGGFVGLLGALLLPLWLGGGLFWYFTTGTLIPALVSLQALAVWAYLLVVRLQACRAFQISPFYALTLPLGSLVFTAMMAASAFKVLSRKGVTWKGRTYLGSP